MASGKIIDRSPAELHEFARGRLGLLIGPSCTTEHPNFFAALAVEIERAFQVPAASSYLETAEEVVASGVPREKLQAAVRMFTEKMRPPSSLGTLAKVRWSSIVSGTLDNFLETRLTAEFEKRPVQRDVSVISSPGQLPSPRSLAVFKALGSASSGDSVLTSADFLRRNAFWSSSTKLFLDEIKASPVLCLGFANTPWLLDSLLAHLFSGSSGHLAKLVLLADDPLVNSTRLSQLVPSHVLVLANGTLKDILRAVEPSSTHMQMTLRLGDGSSSREEDLSGFSDLFTLLTESIQPAIGVEQRQRLLDYLFMPDSIVWDPFIHKLDFERSISRDVEAVLSRNLAQKLSKTIVVHGRAASGKTTVLKRLALTVALTGTPAVWLRSYWYPDADERLDRFFAKLAAASQKKSVVVFFDDPPRLGALTVDTVETAALRHGVVATIVAGIRTSDYDDWEARNKSDHQVFELSDSLDDQEWLALPQYLVEIGASKSIEYATEDVRQTSHNRATRDTLALLYWLLPDTRAAISSSVMDEFVRLGDAGSLRGIVIGAVQRSTALLKEAYAMVAVSCKYGVPLPIEVLVNALGVGYSAWLDAVSTTGPAWGVLYPEDNLDFEGATYRTRNSLVTELVTDSLNGGKIAHHGELGVLKKLLSSCGGTQPLYREYVTKILVPHSNLRQFELSEGTGLYDVAIAALPFADRLILHHKAIFIRTRGGDLTLVIATCREALKTESQSSGAKLERAEFIHTSIAAALLERIKLGQVTLESTKTEALTELEKSRSPTFMNPSGVHVYAGLVFELAGRHKDPSQAGDRSELLNIALAELDHYLTLARTGALSRRFKPDEVQMLETRRHDIVTACGDPLALREQANLLWSSHGSDTGFALTTRVMLEAAIKKADAGSEYSSAYRYWLECKGKIEKSGSMSSAFAEVGLLLYYQWQVCPKSRSFKKASLVDWSLLKETAQVALQSYRLAELPFYRYLYALALAHLNDWDLSRRVFEENRRKSLPTDLLHAARDYLLDDDGRPKRVQGQITKSAMREYLKVDDLNQEFLTERGERWPRAETVQHGYILFSFAGPRAAMSNEHFQKTSGR